MTQGISEIVNMVKEISPFLFETAAKQVHVEIVTYSIGMFVGLLLIMNFVIINNLLKEYFHDEENFVDTNEDFFAFFFPVSILGCVVGIVIMLICGVSIIGRVINPDYYAIEAIISFRRTASFYRNP